MWNRVWNWGNCTGLKLPTFSYSVEGVQLQRRCSSPSFPNSVLLKMMHGELLQDVRDLIKLLLHLVQAPFPPTPNLYPPCTHRWSPSVSSHGYQSAMEMPDMKLRGENRHWSSNFGWYFATLTNYPHFNDSCEIIHFWKPEPISQEEAYHAIQLLNGKLITPH